MRASAAVLLLVGMGWSLTSAIAHIGFPRKSIAKLRIRPRKKLLVTLKQATHSQTIRISRAECRLTNGHHRDKEEVLSKASAPITKLIDIVYTSS